MGLHYANGCNFKVETHHKVIIANFETLSGSDKGKVAWGTHLWLKGYLTLDIADVSGEVENPFARTLPTGSESNSPMAVIPNPTPEK